MTYHPSPPLVSPAPSYPSHLMMNISSEYLYSPSYPLTMFRKREILTYTLIPTLPKLLRGSTFSEYLFFSSRHSIWYAYHVLIKCSFDCHPHLPPTSSMTQWTPTTQGQHLSTSFSLHAILFDMLYDHVPQKRSKYCTLLLSLNSKHLLRSNSGDMLSSVFQGRESDDNG